MHWKKIILLCFFLMFVADAIAQRRVHREGKSVYSTSRHNANATRVRGDKAKIVCPIFQNSKYPFHGLGIKLGDPFALTYKLYATKRLAFAADLGRPASSLYNRYFREKFDKYVVRDTVSSSTSFFTPVTHKVKSDIIAELKVLYHFDVTKISPGLQFYVGGGWEWKRTRIQYDYTYSLGDLNQNDQFGRFERNRFTMGPQAVVGIEYSYFQLPISAFMELEYFYDTLLDPGWRRLEGGVGLRYIFN